MEFVIISLQTKHIRRDEWLYGRSRNYNCTFMTESEYIAIYTVHSDDGRRIITEN